MPLLKQKKDEFVKTEPTEEEYANAEEEEPEEEPIEEEYEEETVGEEPKLKSKVKKEESRLMKEIERLNEKIEELKGEEESLQPKQPITPIPPSPTKRLRPVPQPRKIEVVKELPLHPIRQYKDEDGNTVELMTVEEAMTQILNG